MATTTCGKVMVSTESGEEGDNKETSFSPILHRADEDGDANSVDKEVNWEKEWVDNFMDSIKKKRDDDYGSESECSFPIQKVPERFRQLGQYPYEPHLISIGPFHNAKRRNQLRVMEDVKKSYLKSIVERRGTNWLKECLRTVKKEEGKARECYSQKLRSLNSYAFVEMMVLDGCFIIELFYRTTVGWGDGFAEDSIIKNSVLKNEDMKKMLVIDLLKLENQIPFLILQCIFQLMDIPDQNLTEMAFKFFKKMLSGTDTDVLINFPEVGNVSASHSNVPFKHLLHLFYASVVPHPRDDDRSEKHRLEGLHIIKIRHGKHPARQESENRVKIPSASELQQAGFEFRQNRKAKSFFDIKCQTKFRKGVIEIPPLYSEEWATSVFMNLLVFEQCYYSLHSNSLHTPYISGYTIFMDFLINHAKDVRILYESGIIKKWLGTNDDLAAVFNKMGKEVSLYNKDLYLRDVIKGIEDYYHKPWVVWRASLTRIYYDNPWAIISVIVAILLQLLTLLQPYFK